MIAVIDAVRTPIGSFGGSLKEIPAADLGAIVIKELLERTGLDGTVPDEVIMGNVLQGGLGQNPARQAAVKAGIPYGTPCFTVNKVCGSGMKAVELGCQAIRTGDADIVIAGGMENMSRAPYLLNNARWGYRTGNGEVVDSMVYDGLWCAFGGYHMGITAENIAEKYGITREMQDGFAAVSQQKAEKALKEDRMRSELVPVVIPQKKGSPVIFSYDEYPRPGVTREKLAVLKPAFKNGGTVTAGNSSGVNDGAAAVLLMSEAKAAALGLKPKAYLAGFSSAGVDPEIMGMGLVPAVRKLICKTGIGLKEFDLIEANEAFAVQAVAAGKELGIDMEKANVNGGAIALGHPIGATGARILVTLVEEMVRRGCEKGLAALCIGGGQGMAAAIVR